MTEEQFRNHRIKIIIHYTYLVIGHDKVHDVLEKTLSAPFDVWSSFDKTVKTSLVGKAFWLFSLLLWQHTLIRGDFQLSALLNIHVAMRWPVAVTENLAKYSQNKTLITYCEICVCKVLLVVFEGPVRLRSQPLLAAPATATSHLTYTISPTATTTVADWLVTGCCSVATGSNQSQPLLCTIICK